MQEVNGCDFILFQMNRVCFTKSTGSILVHLKEYNHRLCRKGLLQRMQGLKIAIGDQKSIENDFLCNALRAKNDGTNKKCCLNSMAKSSMG